MRIKHEPGNTTGIEAANKDGLEASGPQEIDRLMAECIQALESGKHQLAFETVQRAKSLRQLRQGLDYLRALCFIKLGRAGDARESLEEELRHFPGNREASTLLADLRARFPNHFVASVKDEEFAALLPRIRKYTMVPEIRLYSLFALARQACRQGIPGNFVECGVAGGGSSAMLAWIIKNHSAIPRRLFAFDSFEGMPAPTEHDTHAGMHADSSGWGTGTCAAPESSLMEISGILQASELVRPVKGFFKDTLPLHREEIGPIGLLHLDGDWYESTRDILDNLYDQVVPGGFLQVDDYGHWEGCKRAMHEFESRRGLKFDLKSIDGEGVWFQKQPVG